MIENISSNAMIYAILALNSEIVLQKEFLDNPEISADDKHNEMGILDDLEQAFTEFIDLYKNRCKSQKDLPSIDELLNNPL